MVKFVYRFPPCPVYDIEGIERWLEEQSLNGMKLVNYSPWGLFVFEKASPQPIRYRLEAAQKRHAFWDENMNPPVSMQELALDCGWSFITYCGGFYIFCCTDPHGPELNTDPSIQAISIKYMKKRWRSSLIVMLVYLAILLFVLGPGFFYHLAAEGSVMILLFLFLVTEIITCFEGLIHIARIHRRLSSGSKLVPRHTSGRSAKRYRFSQYASYVLILVMLLSIGLHHMVRLGLGEHPLTEFPGTPPFVTLEELAPEDTEITCSKIDNGYYQSRPDILIPVNLYWMDGGQIGYPDGEFTAGLLEIQYCETAAPWLARAIGKDYLQFHKTRSGTELALLPDLGVDYAAAITDHFGLNRVVLVEGNIVVCTRFTMADPYGSFTLEAWAQAMAQRFIAEGGS